MKRVVVSEDDFDVAQEYAALCESAPKSGAVVFFVGLVRDLYENHNNSCLLYTSPSPRDA